MGFNSGFKGLRLESFAATDFNENFSGRQTRQDVKVLRRFGLVAPKPINFDATKPPAHPEDEDGVSTRNVGKPSHPDAAVCPRYFHRKYWCLGFGNFRQ